MSFPLMPIAKPPQFMRGELTPRATAFNSSIDCGPPSEDRWIIVVMAAMSSGSIAAYTAPTINGTSMIELDQTYSTFGDDGQRGAIFIGPAKVGTFVNVTSTGSPFVSSVAVYTITGVTAPTTSFVKSTTTNVTNSLGSCVVGYFVSNYGVINSIANMIKYPVTTGETATAYDLYMDTSTVTYTVSSTLTLVLQTKISWSFDY